MVALKFAETHNLVAFLEKPKESDGFAQIVDFLNAHPINYALTVNPTIYTSCIEQFLATAKAKTINGEVQLQALVDGKKTYDAPCHTKNIFANMKREGKGFFGKVTPLFQIMMVQAQKEGEGLAMPIYPQNTPTISQPSTSQPQKKQPKRKQRKDTEVPQPSSSTEPITDEAANEEHVPTHSNDPLLSGEDRLKLNELMELCTNLSQRVLNLETTKTAQAMEIASLKKKEDASKQGRKIANLDADAEVTLVDETQGRNDDNLMFDTGVLDEHEVKVERVVSISEVTTASATTTTVDELTLAQTLIEIKAAKPKLFNLCYINSTAVKDPRARGL
ncbi:hypothetical protein Tco_0800440 [Tanacetum coccineum]|uniref:Uncharacterized protein n=2 Tax=Tanacetum coccineum TaxID=301880 RepID=A0ABQ4ZWF4_9ASTR